MNEEEKNAIEYLKNRLYGNEDCKYIDVAQEDLRVFIKLIEKLQKENEELKKLHIQDNKHLDFIMEHSITVQKLKDKIEEIKERKMDIVMSTIHNRDEKIEILKKDKIRIQVLQELLEGRK